MGFSVQGSEGLQPQKQNQNKFNQGNGEDFLQIISDLVDKEINENATADNEELANLRKKVSTTEVPDFGLGHLGITQSDPAAYIKEQQELSNKLGKQSNYAQGYKPIDDLF